MRRFQSSFLVLVLGAATPVWAYDDLDASVPESVASAPVGPIEPFVPSAVDYPGMVDRGPAFSLYLDHTYQSTNDLSTFWWVRGRGNNYRLALGGTFRFGSFQVHGEIPVQYTQLSIDTLMGEPPTDADKTKGALSLGDIVADGSFLWDLGLDGIRTYLGLGLRVRLPTHTTKFSFGLVDGSTMEFGFPYYLHLAPAALLSTSYGPVFLVANEGVLAMLAKDIDLGGILQRIPNLYFWESHVALGLAATDWLAVTMELLNVVQLNHAAIADPTTGGQTSIEEIRATFINPGLTVDIGNYRLTVAGRLDLSGRSSRDFGVLTFSGSRAFLTRLSYLF